MGVGFAVFAHGLSGGVEPSLWVLGGGVLIFGVGFGMGITPGTELIIEGLPADRRSVASAVNDITREVGGVLGIAVLSSILISFYRTEIEPAVAGLPDEVKEVVRRRRGCDDRPCGRVRPAGGGAGDRRPRGLRRRAQRVDVGRRRRPRGCSPHHPRDRAGTPCGEVIDPARCREASLPPMLSLWSQDAGMMGQFVVVRPGESVGVVAGSGHAH